METIRRGLTGHVVGRRIVGTRVLHPRVLRRQPGGEAEFTRLLTGRRVLGLGRRGKYLWWELSGGLALVIHLGMSGQLRIGAGPHRHLRATVSLEGTEVDFIDQRTFGSMTVAQLTEGGLPGPVVGIAPDLLAADLPVLAQDIRRRRSAIKRVLLNQNVVSGIGNIYADEMLWAARIHPERPAGELTGRSALGLLHAGVEVLEAAISAGGTSFDELYVHVNGESGYFDRSLRAYGQQTCARCGGDIVAVAFMNRRSHFCPRCQR